MQSGAPRARRAARAALAARLVHARLLGALRPAAHGRGRPARVAPARVGAGRQARLLRAGGEGAPGGAGPRQGARRGRARPLPRRGLRARPPDLVPRGAPALRRRGARRRPRRRARRCVLALPPLCAGRRDARPRPRGGPRRARPRLGGAGPRRPREDGRLPERGGRLARHRRRRAGSGATAGGARPHRHVVRARGARGLGPRRRAPGRRRARHAPPGGGPAGERLGPAPRRGHLPARRAHGPTGVPPPGARRDARPRDGRRARGPARRRVLRLGGPRRIPRRGVALAQPAQPAHAPAHGRRPAAPRRARASRPRPRRRSPRPRAPSTARTPTTPRTSSTSATACRVTSARPRT